VQNTGNADCFGNVVKAARKEKGLTQSQLSKKLSISTRYLKAIENSGRKPSFDLLVRIIHELDIQTDAVFYPEQTVESSDKLISFWKTS